MAERMAVAPIDSYNMSAMMEKHAALKQIGKQLTPRNDDDDDMDDNNELF